MLSPGPEGKTGLDEWMKAVVSGCPHERLLEAAFAWLTGIGDEELYHLISFKEFTAVRAKTESIAASLTFGALSGLYTQEIFAPGFRRLLGLNAFLPTVELLEKRSKLKVQW